ncbi:MAG: hypothetical protein ACRDHE_01190 [Ktedonobacterales bacterium]
MEQRIATWPAFLELIDERAATVLPYYERHPEFRYEGAPASPYADHRIDAGFELFFDLTRGERFDVYEDAVVRGVVERDSVYEYDGDERCGEDEAFINIVASELPTLLDTRFS